MNLNQMVDDAAEVSRYLIDKFHKQKIYILGHSWGTLLSSYTIHKYPDHLPLTLTKVSIPTIKKFIKRHLLWLDNTLLFLNTPGCHATHILNIGCFDGFI
jgi:pimeloyl-ACP methyl ester carboxylesterase